MSTPCDPPPPPIRRVSCSTHGRGRGVRTTRSLPTTFFARAHGGPNERRGIARGVHSCIAWLWDPVETRQEIVALCARFRGLLVHNRAISRMGMAQCMERGEEPPPSYQGREPPLGHCRRWSLCRLPPHPYGADSPPRRRDLGSPRVPIDDPDNAETA